MKTVKALRKGELFDVMVSDQDYELVSQYKWYLSVGYAAAHIGGKLVKMHRFIMGAKEGQMIDHIDRNKLNNTRDNLRFATHQENMHNRSCGRIKRKRKYTGVERALIGGVEKFNAVITRNGKQHKSCRYSSEIAAAHRYNQMLDENNFNGVKNKLDLSESELNKLLETTRCYPLRGAELVIRAKERGSYRPRSASRQDRASIS